jgi:hypothetical protein
VAAWPLELSALTHVYPPPFAALLLCVRRVKNRTLLPLGLEYSVQRTLLAVTHYPLRPSDPFLALCSLIRLQFSGLVGCRSGHGQEHGTPIIPEDRLR